MPALNGVGGQVGLRPKVCALEEGGEAPELSVEGAADSPVTAG